MKIIQGRKWQTESVPAESQARGLAFLPSQSNYSLPKSVTSVVPIYLERALLSTSQRKNVQQLRRHANVVAQELDYKSLDVKLL